MIEFTNISPDAADCPQLLRRLQQRDASLWDGGTDTLRDISSRLGWLDAAAFIDQHHDRIIDFARGVRDEGYQQVVLLGMGGSSLAPEVCAAMFGDRPGALPLIVVDTTAPEHVAAVTAGCEKRKTLFIVSSKSGTTAETRALDVHFFCWMAAREEQPARHFTAITDAGSALEALAAERGYRDVFLNPADIGGRFSALSFFGLVPAALAGIDPAALRRHIPTDVGDPDTAGDACRLGRALGALAGEGRNKLTLCFSPSLTAAAPWMEQLIDESTGKDGTGIVVVADEPRFEPAAYSGDRVFTVVDMVEEPVDDDWVAGIAAHGHPVARWRLQSIDEIGAEFMRWEVATAVAGRVLDINPFDEPDVDASKSATRALLAATEHSQAAAPQPLSALRDMLGQAVAGDYLAILAYLAPGPDTHRQLGRLRERLTRHTGLPCCVGFGPRYLHSSGQLHKGGPNQGLFIVLTAASEPDLPIPGQAHGFRELIRAQANGDLRVLRERGRRAVHLELDDEHGVEELLDLVP